VVLLHIASALVLRSAEGEVVLMAMEIASRGTRGILLHIASALVVRVMEVVSTVIGLASRDSAER
jgi:hypothetical protein